MSQGARKNNGTSGVDLADKVAQLRQADTYPEPPGEITTRETHMSWVFLTDHYVYKLKKPVHFTYLDFRSLNARHHNCLEEIRLNRRLAADVYLGVVPLSLRHDGQLHLGDEGTVVEWLVQMRRLPARRMFDRLIEQDALNKRDCRSVATVLAHFYHQSEPVPSSRGEYLMELEQVMRCNQQALDAPDFELAGRYRRVQHTLSAFACSQASLLGERAEKGNIIEGHGDLRPEHICVEPLPVMFDCLEFNRRMRLVDPVDELGFLAMECTRMGAPWVEAELFRCYRAVTGDTPSRQLIAFYQCYRACLWARLARWRLDEHTDVHKWRRRVDSYLQLAAHYADQLNL